MSEQDNTSNLEESMMNPKKVQVDDRTVEQHPLQDVIAMDRYVNAKKAMRSGKTGLRFSKMEASGSVR